MFGLGPFHTPSPFIRGTVLRKKGAIMALTYIREVSGQDPWQGEGQVAKLYHDPNEDWHVVVTAIPATEDEPAEAGAFKVGADGEANFETFILPPVMLPAEDVTDDAEANIVATVAHFDQLASELPPLGENDGLDGLIEALSDLFGEGDNDPF